MRRPRGRLIAFSLVVIASLAGAGFYAGHAARKQGAAVSGAPASLALTDMPDAAARPFMLFRSTALGPDYGRASLVYLDDPSRQRQVSSLQCDRIHYAAGHGICLEARRGVSTSYLAHIFDARLAIRSTLPLAGPPSRARVSPTGRIAAVTVFTSGHSYSTADFSTRTSLIDAVAGHLLVDDLETFAVSRDGSRFKAADFNLWGVTFAADGNRFYATLGSGGVPYLVEGDIARRAMRVVRADVECPSLSPDGRHIAFKRRVADAGLGRTVWRLYVLELASGQVTPLQAEARNVDDQVEWLDAGRIVYAMPDDSAAGQGSTQLWALPISGAGAPELLLPSAFSPSVGHR